MGYAFVNDRRVPLISSRDYKEACFSIWHAAFLNDSGTYCFPIEEKPSFEMAFSFYREKIVKLKSYPICLDDGSFVDRDPKDREVLRQVLGIPKTVFESMDPTRDVLSQIVYRKNLSDLKKSSYRMLCFDENRKWYRDDFKLFCLTEGVFFPYEETLPFVMEDESRFPVFVDESKLPSVLKKYVSTCNAERLVIDFLGRDASQAQYEAFLKFDSLPFEKKLSYFFLENHTLSDSERDYLRCLKGFIATMVNHLYDLYLSEVLNHSLQKSSFLTPFKPWKRGTVEVVSSYNGDVFLDSKGRASFDSYNRKVFNALVHDALVTYQDKSLLLLYARLGLPYEGYVPLKAHHYRSLENIVRYFEYTESLDETDDFFSPKRVDRFYSYFPFSLYHEYGFYRRELLKAGILFDVDDVKDIENSKISVRRLFSSTERELNVFFDGSDPNTLEDVYFSYVIEKGLDPYLSLKKSVLELKRKSEGKAVNLFFSLLDHRSIKDAMELLYRKLSVSDIPSCAFSFFLYLTFFPFKIAKGMHYRHLKKYDPLTLEMIQKKENTGFFYEPSLPSPFVEYGSIYVGFSSDSSLRDMAICSCQKKSIQERIAFLEGIAKKAKPKNRSEINAFVVMKLGLPSFIERRIDVNQDILSQIPFRSSICHLCNHMEPSNHPEGYVNEAYVYRNYILSNAQKYGVYLDHLYFSVSEEVLDSDYLPSSELIVPEKVVPLFRKFLIRDVDDLSVMVMYSMLSSRVYFDDFIGMLDYFNLYHPDFRIYGHDSKQFLDSSMAMLTSYCLYMNRIQTSYAIEMAKPALPPLSDYRFGLFGDYNPRLPYPQVCLGKIYNAYKPNLNSDEFYFCKCEKESMAALIEIMVRQANRNHGGKNTAPLILSAAGLPYEVILKYKDYDFTLHSGREFVEQLSFKEHICRRCLNQSHAALAPSGVVFPFKDDMEAEFTFAFNRIAHYGALITERDMKELTFDPKRRYRLYDDDSPLLLYLDGMPLELCGYFMPSVSALKAMMDDFRKEDTGFNPKSVETALKGILESYEDNGNSIWCFFCTNHFRVSTLNSRASILFPRLITVNEEVPEDVMQVVISFLSYFFYDFLKRLAKEESYIGRNV